MLANGTTLPQYTFNTTGNGTSLTNATGQIISTKSLIAGSNNAFDTTSQTGSIVINSLSPNQEIVPYLLSTSSIAAANRMSYYLVYAAYAGTIKSVVIHTQTMSSDTVGAAIYRGTFAIGTRPLVGSIAAASQISNAIIELTLVPAAGQNLFFNKNDPFIVCIGSNGTTGTGYLAMTGNASPTFSFFVVTTSGTPFPTTAPANGTPFATKHALVVRFV